jgi:glycosyltransferase involved in cell wall biosynthesis
MKKFPRVSVILTTRNEVGNIGRFLESIKKQSFKNFELIVVDNHSTDQTKTIAKKYTNLVYNFGPERSAQRNYGAVKSKGKYLVFLDADMELSPKVIEDCLETADKLNLKILTIPEKTVGNGFMPNIRKFEREMYLGEFNYEVPRFFEKKVFFEFGGYDERLTGPEDYDLPYRISKKYKIGRSKEYLYHHEEGLTLKKLLDKKFYYAKSGAFYASKHPKLIWIQGTILFRKVYLKHWRKFLKHPILGLFFLAIRFLETLWAIAGFISAVGMIDFLKILFRWFKNEK